MDIFDDLQAEQHRLSEILSALSDTAWSTPSAASGWTVADVVLHLAQSDEFVTVDNSQAPNLSGGDPPPEGQSVDELMDQMVHAQRAHPAEIFTRFEAARRRSLQTLRQASPSAAIAWAAGPLRPSTLATTRLAEYWAHGLDITGPLGIDFEDTSRLRHVAWLGHRSLPYAFSLQGESAPEVRCELTSPGGDVWSFGPSGAHNHITGPAGDFCRVGARRMKPEQSRLHATGPDARLVLAALRNYAA